MIALDSTAANAAWMRAMRRTRPASSAFESFVLGSFLLESFLLESSADNSAGALVSSGDTDVQ
jgi:hypothetical protein